MEAVVLDGPSAGRRAWQVLAWMAATAAAAGDCSIDLPVASQPGRPSGRVVALGEQASRRRSQLPPRSSSDHDLVESDPRPRSASPRAPSLGAFQLLPRGGYGVASPTWLRRRFPTRSSGSRRSSGYAPGIRPIRVSFAMLWEALWRTIPGLGSSESGSQSPLRRPGLQAAGLGRLLRHLESAATTGTIGPPCRADRNLCATSRAAPAAFFRKTAHFLWAMYFISSPRR